jgi:hypothetical protein
MSISAVGSSHPATVPPKASEATERKGAPDHDGDRDDAAASVSTPSTSSAGELQPGFSLRA